jgi:hypothetical protein
MEGPITDSARAAMLRAAVARVGRDQLRQALAFMVDSQVAVPKAVGNALNALRKHRDPAQVVTRAQYRAALPYVAAAVSDECLTRTIEVLGDHSDDPTREQLVEAMEQVRDSFDDVTIAVMLASVADGEMPASDLCFDLLATDERYGLTGVTDPGTEPDPGTAAPDAAPVPVVTAEQREARRLKKQRDAAERRKKAEAARRASEQVRRARKQERASGSGPVAGEPSPVRSGTGTSVPGETPRLIRRASLTPLQEEQFDRDDPWVTGVIYAWVPFDAVDPSQPGLDGKSRRCVVVAGSPTELLVRPGYSDGGVKSRDWKSVPLGHWRRSGFDQPTWIDTEILRVPRPTDQEPVGWLSPEDWNALW